MKTGVFAHKFRLHRGMWGWTPCSAGHGTLSPGQLGAFLPDPSLCTMGTSAQEWDLWGTRTLVPFKPRAFSFHLFPFLKH